MRAHLAIAAATALLLLAGGAHGEVNAGKADSAEVRERLSALRREIAAVNAVLSAKSSELDSAANDLRSAELAIASSARTVIELNIRLNNSALEFEALTQQEQ